MLFRRARFAYLLCLRLHACLRGHGDAGRSESLMKKCIRGRAEGDGAEKGRVGSSSHGRGGRMLDHAGARGAGKGAGRGALNSLLASTAFCPATPQLCYPAAQPLTPCASRMLASRAGGARCPAPVSPVRLSVLSEPLCRSIQREPLAAARRTAPGKSNRPKQDQSRGVPDLERSD